MGGRGGRSHNASAGAQGGKYGGAMRLARKLGISVNLSSLQRANIHPQNVMETMQAVESIYREFPVMRGKVHYLDAVQTSKNALASAGGDGGLHMGLYGRYSESQLQQSWNYSTMTGFHPKGTSSAGIFVHEMGHQMESYLNERDYGDPWAWGRSSDSIVLEAARRLDTTVTTIHSEKVYMMARDISKYAVDEFTRSRMSWSTWETLAEATQDYFENREKAKPLSKEIWAVLKERMK